MKLPKILAKDRGSLLMEICIAIAIFSISLPTSILIIHTIKSELHRAKQKRIDLYESVENMENTFANLKSNFDYSLPEIQESSPCMRKFRFGGLERYLASESEALKLGGDCGTGENISDINQILTKTITNISNINDLDEIKNFAFTAGDKPNHLSIFDTLDRTSPNLLATTSLPGVFGSYPNALSIFYYDSKLYIGVHRTAGPEFHIWDASNPRNIFWLGSRELNHNINAISVRGNNAFLATSGNTKNLIILDISNPKNIFMKSSLALPGTEDAISTFQTGKNLYLGRKSGHGVNNIYSIDVSDTYSPTISSSTITNGNIVSLFVSGDNLFAISSSTEKNLLRLDRKSLKILETVLISNIYERF